MRVFAIVLTVLIAFLLGSIPSGLIISKQVYKTDIREHGSGNIGTTNALRILGKVGGITVFLLDAGKGLLSGVIAALLYQQFVAADPSTLVFFHPQISSAGAQSMLSAAFFGCVLGHVFSPWLGFKGGKGIATAVGCAFMTLGWLPSLCLLALFALGVLVTRYVSVSSLVAAFACALCAVWVFWGNYGAIVTTVVACTFLIWSHRANIKRLMQGTEPRVGKRKEEGSIT